MQTRQWLLCGHFLAANQGSSMKTSVFVGLNIFAVSCFFGLMGSMVYLHHVKSMACIQAHGQMDSGNCMFIDRKAPSGG
jgi:hypothetical protein